MICAQGLLRLLWGGARSWSAMGLGKDASEKRRIVEDKRKSVIAQLAAHCKRSNLVTLKKGNHLGEA